MVTFGHPPYGGVAGQIRKLSPLSQPADNYGYRLIPAGAWWDLIMPHWRRYNAALARVILATPPTLAPKSSRGVYFTDRESLEGLIDASAIARRLALLPHNQIACDYEGCVIIKFNTSSLQNRIRHPKPSGAAGRGSTINGAREWVIDGNVSLDYDMEALCIDWGRNSEPRYYPIPLWIINKYHTE